MKGNGTLVKLAGSLDTHQAAVAAAVPADYEIKPLFTVAPPPPSSKQAAVPAAPAPMHTWALVQPRTNGVAAQAAVQHPWDAAHEIRRRLGTQVVAAEPDLEQVWLPEEPIGGDARALAARTEDPTEPDDEKGAPFARGPHPNWHIDDDYSQLRTAREAVGAGRSAIKIVHLDTRYDPRHKARPEFIVTADERNSRCGRKHSIFWRSRTRRRRLGS